MHNVRQTGLEKQQAVQEKLAQLACYREGINAHLTASIALAEESPGGLLMPNQSLLYTGRVLRRSAMPGAMHIARELCGGQICVTPDAATFAGAETGPWMEKFYSINERWTAEDRRRLLAYARDLLNSDYAGHRLTFQLFAQSPPFANLAAVYRSFDWSRPATARAAGGGPVGGACSRLGADPTCRRTSTSCPFNTKDTYPEQRHRQRPRPGRRRGGHDLSPRAGRADLETRESVAHRRPRRADPERHGQRRAAARECGREGRDI